MRTDLELMDTFRVNIENERKKRNLTQQQWSNKIGMSLSSYRRMVSGEMQLQASIVIKNLYFETGLCCHELMEVYDDYLSVKSKINRLDKQQLAFVESVIDYVLKKEPVV